MSGFIRFFILVIFSIAASVSANANVVELNEKMSSYTLGKQLKIAENVDPNITFEEITQLPERFKTSNSEMPNYGYTDSIYWFKFTVRNSSSIHNWILEQKFPVTHYLDLYIFDPNKNTTIIKKSGSLIPPSERDIQHPRIVFKLDIPQGETREIFLRLQSKASIVVDFQIQTLDSFLDNRSNESLVSGIFYGALAIMFFYILLIYSFLRDTTFRWLSIFILCASITYSFIDALFHYVVPVAPDLIKIIGGAISFCIMNIALLMYTKIITPSSNEHIWLDAFRKYSIYGYSALIILFPFAPFYMLATAMFVLAVSNYIFIISRIVFYGFRGNKEAQLFISGWLPIVISSVIAMLIRIGVMDSEPWAEYTARLSMIWLVLFMSLSVSTRIKQLKEEKIEVNQALKTSKSRFNALFDHTFEHFILLNPNGDILELNRSAIKSFKSKQEDIVNKKIWEAFTNDDPEETQALIKKHVNVSAKGYFSRFEICKKDANNNTTYLDYSIKPILDKNENVELLVMEGRDITKLKIAIDEANKANNTKAEFLANMSHELRTPMHAIISFSNFGLKKMGTVSEEKIRGYFNSIHSSAERLMELINDLLDLSKFEAGKMALDFNSHSPVTTFMECVNEIYPLANKKNIEIRLSDDNKARSWIYDELRIKQVILNLLSNAIKFSKENQNIHACISVEDDFEGDVLHISVTNSGENIPIDELSKIFQKFEQSSKTKSGAGGTGLGLAISHSIITQHGGEIWAENNPEGGAVFHFTLPEVSSSQVA